MSAVYVAAPFARFMDSFAVTNDLRAAGHTSTSWWIHAAYTTRGVEALTDRSAAVALATNDADVDRSDAMIVLAYPGEGGEMFCEMSRALARGIPVFYVGGRLVLSAFRPGVTRCASVADAIAALGALEWPPGLAPIDDG